MPAYIDLPTEPIGSNRFTVAGWVASSSEQERILLRINGREVNHVLHDRPDVRQVLSGFPIVHGVFAEADLRLLDQPRTVTIQLSCGADHADRVCEVSAEVIAAQQLDDQARIASRQFCLDHLICAQCGAAGEALHISEAEIACVRCGTRFAQAAAAINMISPELGLRSNVVPTENVSSNPYSPEARELIERAAEAGGWVLDCGAGARPARLPHVVNTEIVDYPSTDVLAVGEALPFQDNTFDAVLSLAVLEHVRDPFRCAKELLRVVKPGGEILADVPFLQPVHGYPNHYYNMTQQGLTNLFAEGGEIISCHVPPHGHPIFAVQWILREYVAGLPHGARERFETMTIGQAATLDPHDFLRRQEAFELASKAQSVVACLNSVHVRKR